MRPSALPQTVMKLTACLKTITRHGAAAAATTDRNSSLPGQIPQHLTLYANITPFQINHKHAHALSSGLCIQKSQVLKAWVCCLLRINIPSFIFKSSETISTLYFNRSASASEYLRRHCMKNVQTKLLNSGGGKENNSNTETSMTSCRLLVMVP